MVTLHIVWEPHRGTLAMQFEAPLIPCNWDQFDHAFWFGLGVGVFARVGQACEITWNYSVQMLTDHWYPDSVLFPLFTESTFLEKPLLESSILHMLFNVLNYSV